MQRSLFVSCGTLSEPPADLGTLAAHVVVSPADLAHVSGLVAGRLHVPPRFHSLWLRLTCAAPTHRRTRKGWMDEQLALHPGSGSCVALGPSKGARKVRATCAGLVGLLCDLP